MGTNGQRRKQNSLLGEDCLLPYSAEEKRRRPGGNADGRKHQSKLQKKICTTQSHRFHIWSYVGCHARSCHPKRD